MMALSPINPVTVNRGLNDRDLLATTLSARLDREGKRCIVADALGLDLDQPIGFAANSGEALPASPAGIADRHRILAGFHDQL